MERSWRSRTHVPWTESNLRRYAEDSIAPGCSLMWTISNNSGLSQATRIDRRPAVAEGDVRFKVAPRQHHEIK